MADVNVVTAQFTSWKHLPDVTDLAKIENSSVYAARGDIVYVAYTLENGKVAAFGSCGYYRVENYYSQDTRRQLWIEGMVSTVKGHGSRILAELEKVLTMLADQYEVPIRLINVMSAEESIGFYEKNGYVECNTSVRFRGPGNIRCVKSINGFSLEIAKVAKYRLDSGYAEESIVSFLFQKRRMRVDEYLLIPATIIPKQLAKYFSENYENDELYLETTKHLKSKIIEYFLDVSDGMEWSE